MRCLYCGKKLSLLKKAQGNEFCSPQHHDAYAQQAENALKRLLADNDSPEKEKTPASATVAETPAPVIAAAPPPVTAAVPPPVINEAVDEKAPPVAPLAHESVRAQAPLEGPKLVPCGPEAIALAPLIPRMGLAGAASAEVRAPLSIIGTASSVLLATPITSPRVKDPEELEFLTELSRPRLAVSPVTEWPVPDTSAETEATPEPEAIADEPKTSGFAQKLTFAEGFVSPWTLVTAAPPFLVNTPLNHDLSIPAELSQLNLRLMNAGRLEHLGVQVTTDGLSVQACFADAPVPGASTAILPVEHTDSPLKRPRPAAIGNPAEMQIRGAERVPEAVQSTRSQTPFAGFLVREKIAPGPPRPVRGISVLAAARSGELIPIEKSAVAEQSRTGLDVKAVFPRSIVTLQRRPGVYAASPPTPAELCPLVEVKAPGAKVESETVAALPPAIGVARLPALCLPLQADGLKTPALGSGELERPSTSVKNVEKLARDLRVPALERKVWHSAPGPFEPDQVSALTWSRETSVCRIRPEVAQVSVTPARFLPEAELSLGRCRLGQAQRVSSPHLLLSSHSLADYRSLNFVKAQSVDSPPIAVPVAVHLAGKPVWIYSPAMELRYLESIIYVDLIQPGGRLPIRPAFVGSSTLDLVPWNALPGARLPRRAAAMAPQFPSVEWLPSSNDLPQYQPLVKSLPFRRLPVLAK